MQRILRSRILSQNRRAIIQCDSIDSVLAAKNTSASWSIARYHGVTSSTKSALASSRTCHRPSCCIQRIQRSSTTSISISTPTTATTPYQRRSFINIPNIFNNNNNNNNNNSNNNNTPQSIRTLRASRTLPFPPEPLFEIIASVESYSEFLPFLAASTVTARDPESRYPSQAFLTVGYGPFTEKFTSRVICDRSKWIVEARSGGGIGDDGRPVPGGDEGLFSHLSTKWVLVPRASSSSSSSSPSQQETDVRLEIYFRFQNPMHTVIMSAVEDKIAGVMVEAFEKRIKEQMTLNR